MKCQQTNADNNEKNKVVEQQQPQQTTALSPSLVSEKSLSDSEEEIKPLPAGFAPGPMDVICARGKSAFSHPGNRQYRKTIRLHLKQYSDAKTKSDKTCIVSYIMDSIREESSSGVGFVKLMEDNRWYEVGEHIAREKIGQSFRDLLHTKYRSSSKAKKARQKTRREKLTTASNSSSPAAEKSEVTVKDSESNKLSDSTNTITIKPKSYIVTPKADIETSKSDVTCTSSSNPTTPGNIKREISFSDSENLNQLTHNNENNAATPATEENTSTSSGWDDDDEPIPIEQAPAVYPVEQGPVYAFSMVSPDNSFSESSSSSSEPVYCKELLDAMDTICEDEPIPINVDTTYVPVYEESITYREELLDAMVSLWDTTDGILDFQ